MLLCPLHNNSQLMKGLLLGIMLRWCSDLELACCSVYTQWWLFVPSGWALQAQEHSAQARELLPFCSSISSCGGEKLEVLLCLLGIHLTRGGASLLTAKYPCHDMFYNNVWDWTELSSWISPWLFSTLEEAESSFLEAERVVEELHQHDGINQEEKIKTELEISTGLSRYFF